jgi:hypothetical protein
MLAIWMGRHIFFKLQFLILFISFHGLGSKKRELHTKVKTNL